MSERFEVTMRLTQELFDTQYAELRRLHPSSDERQMRWRWTALNYGAELAAEVYGPL